VPAPQATVEAPDIFGQLRRTPDGLVFAALNVNRDERCENALVRIETDLPIAEWNCETGERLLVEAESSNGWKTFSADFPKGGNKLYVASPNAASAPRTARTEGEGKIVPVGAGPLEYTLSEPNVCVLDFAGYRFGDGDWQPETDVLKVDRQLRNEHGIALRGGEMCQPWFTAQQPEKELGDVELRYSFEIEAMPGWIDLVVEEPENFKIEFNGKPVDGSGSRPWIDIAFHRIRIPADVPVLGKNEIVLKTRYKEGSNLEAIYLLGDFGVRLDGSVRKIVPVVGRVEIGDLCAQGFPFYSGAITYHLPLPEGTGRLRLPSFGGACAKIGGQVLGWDPFEAGVSGDSVDVEIILTRRNTFGPLHDLVEGRKHNGPDHWLTEGADFSPEPVLLPTGLLAPPLALV
jgi:hypothetical protein